MGKTQYTSIKIFDGLFLILNPKNSPNYQVRIRIASLNKHIVKSSGTSNLAEAKEFAKGVYHQLDKNQTLKQSYGKLVMRFRDFNQVTKLHLK